MLDPRAFITRYLVEQALDGVFKTRFDSLRRQHEAEATGTARKRLSDPNTYDLPVLNDPQRKALIRFWEAWQEEENSTTPSTRATASSATRQSTPKPSTGRPPSSKSSFSAGVRPRRSACPFRRAKATELYADDLNVIDCDHESDIARTRNRDA